MSITAPSTTATMGQEMATTGTTLRRGAAVAGASALAMAVYQVATPGAPSGTYESWSDYLREFLTLAYLGGSIAAMRAARRSQFASRAAARLVIAGYSLITAGVMSGLALRKDPEWFFVLGGPGLLLSGVGFIIFAISARRRSILPLWAAVLLGVGGFFALFLAEIGTSVLIGSFWLYVTAGHRGGTTPPARPDLRSPDAIWRDSRIGENPTDHCYTVGHDAPPTAGPTFPGRTPDGRRSP